MSPSRHLAFAALLAAAAGCSSVSTARIQPEAVHVGPRLRPIAVVHAQVTSAYILFFGLPGHVSLDHVVNRMLLPAAKALGADKVVDIRVEITPDDGIWVLRRVLGWRSARASGVAVVVEEDGAPAAGSAAAAPAPPAGRAP